MHQYLRQDCEEVSGNSVLPADKPKELVKKLGSVLGININESNISAAAHKTTRYEEGQGQNDSSCAET